MKIGILTQALHGNYGGILQNYALQQVLRKMGHEPITIDRHKFARESKIKGVAKHLLRLRSSQFEASMLTWTEKRIISAKQIKFVEQYINRKGPIYTQTDFNKEVSKSEWDAFIVGSDQCWRPRYSANITNYYLDFAEEMDVKRVAYASSFGVDTWEYTPEQTAKVSSAAKKMDAISVRESSGQSLCQKFLGVKADWVLDPTMLLGAEGFRKFVNKEQEEHMFITDYLLEPTEETFRLIQQIKQAYDISEIRHNNNVKIFNRFESVSKYSDISIEEWISNIANAKFVVTDSFHGVVFAIMFNVPFVVKLNNIRGNTRIESLLQDFNLMDRIVTEGSEFVNQAIDWAQVNNHLENRREYSQKFLKDALD